MLLKVSAACTGYPFIDPLKFSFLMFGFTSCFIIADYSKQRESKFINFNK